MSMYSYFQRQNIAFVYDIYIQTSSTQIKGQNSKVFYLACHEVNLCHRIQNMDAKNREESEEAYKWLTKRHSQEWSQSHFSVSSKCDIELNNGCKAFNKTLLDDRGKLILNMLTPMQMGFMIQLQKRPEKMRRCEGCLCPKIKKKKN